MQHTIDIKLQDLECPVNHFTEICDGIISRPWLTQGLKKNNLDRNVVDKLVAILDEMAELKRMSPVALDWSDTASIREQLNRRRAMKLAAEWDADKIRELLEPENGTTTKI